MATWPGDMVIARVGDKAWSIGKADVEGMFFKGKAFMQQPLLWVI
jgi:hypothetical protein